MIDAAPGGTGGQLSAPDDPYLLIQQALAGDPTSVRLLVDRLSPIIAKRVAATLWRRAGHRNVPQEAADMVQDVFLSLFQSDGRALRAWDPGRGMSFEGFVGLLTQHQVISILRSGRTAPWREELTDVERLEAVGATSSSPEAVISSRENLRELLDRLRERLSPRGLELFQRIVIDEEAAESLLATTGLTRDAIYQWKSRLHRTIRAVAAEMDLPSMSEIAGTLRIVKGAPQT